MTPSSGDLPAGVTMTSSDWPLELHRVLRRAGVVQVTYVPDAGHARLITLCQEDGAMKPVVLTSEQEGIGVLAGAYLGGERGVLLMQSSGAGNCINALSMIKVCGFPLLMIVTMRGEWGEFNPWQVPMGQSTEQCLRAQGVIVERVTEAARIVETVEAAARLAFNSSCAVAVLISQRIIGAKTFDER
jgi:sulfopyruvate decarboxylase alpha subunit